MNVGFFGLQFSFGLQQANMAPIYRYLGADEATLPLLWLAGPATGLLVQPLVGALSDRTTSRLGRRTPYFLAGALLCSLCLFAMPYSGALWIAASLLWILDAANNVTMEPYRAYVGDRLSDDQRPLGYLTQSAFTGLAQTLAYASPSFLVWAGMSPDMVDANHIPVITRIAFLAGAVISLAGILWSVFSVPELPLTATELARIRAHRPSPRQTLADLTAAVREMPRPMRQLAPAMLFQWFAMFGYWQFIASALARSLYGTSDAHSSGFHAAALISGEIGATYNLIAFIAAFFLVPFTRKVGARLVHAVCLIASGAAMASIAHIDSQSGLMVAMLGIGLGWASLMGSPYIMLADAIPPERNGIYMGIFNMFIVIPMLIETLLLPIIYQPLLQGDPRNVLTMCGVLMLLAAIATLCVASTVHDTKRAERA
ncbi:MAG: MFS transporter [Sphingomonas sp.]|nr:MAG: MFS transporter [Sphingomonas sp.]